MSKRAFLIATALGLGISMFVQISASAGEKVGDIEVNVQQLPSKDSRSGRPYGTRHGYVEYRVQLKNSSTENRIVHLSYPGTRYADVSYGVVTTRTVHIAGGQEVLVSLYQPPRGVANEMMEVQVEGVHEGKVIPVASLYDQYAYNGADKVAVLISRNVPQEFCERRNFES